MLRSDCGDARRHHANETPVQIEARDHVHGRTLGIRSTAPAQAAVKPASIASTLPVVEAAPGELNHRMPEATSTAVL